MSDLQTYVISRLCRWATYVRWLSRGGVDPRPAYLRSWWGKLVQARNPRPEGEPAVSDVCPVDIIEARETRRAIDALPEHLRETIIEEYLIGGTQKQKAEALHIDERTLRRRREQAHGLLLGLFNDIAAGLEPRCEPTAVGRPPIVASRQAA